MEQLISYGSVRRGLLGVNIGDIDPDTAATLGLHDNSGALVSSVNPNSAAERAGIRVEDVIVSINGTRIRDSGSLKALIGLLRPGEQVRVGLIRDGREQTVVAELGELQATPTAPEPEPELNSDLDPAFDGAEIVPNDPAGTPGLLVARVEPDSPADLQGLRPGDVITRVNRVAVRTMADATQLVKGARSIILTVQRGNREQLILLR
jgi:S1-C subfamily serine protease